MIKSNKVLVTQERLKELLDYNPETGIFTWNQTVAKNVKRGSIAGCVDNLGYIIIRIDRKGYKAHRLAWLYHYGTWPIGDIDHVDGNTADNRIAYLKDVTRQGNTLNRKCHREGHLVGTSFDKKHQKWFSYARIDGKQKHLGYYLTRIEAYEVSLKARLEIGS